MALKKKTVKPTKVNEDVNPDVENEEKAEKSEQASKGTADVPKPVKQKARVPASVKSSNIFIKNDDLITVCQEAEYGTFPQFSASNGTIMNSEMNLGSEIEFQVITAKDVWKMSTGSNDEEAKEYFDVSYEGEEALEGALEEAIEAGYDKASIKKYLDLYVFITSCNEEDMVNEIAVLSLSPSSLFNWRKLSGKLQSKAVLGMLNTTEVIPDAPAVTFRAKAKPTSYKGNNYTVMEFSIL